MREKLEWLTLLVPGGILTVLIVVSMIGKGPVLEEIPEKWKGNDMAQVESPLPIVTAKPDTKQLEKKKAEKKKEQVKTLSYDGPENGYEDGTYYGSASGYGGTIQVSVTITDGKITGVNIVSAAGETPSFLAQAKAVCGRIVSAQSPNVDVVSGATYSSNGIINATIAALKQAGATDLAVTNTIARTKQTPKPVSTNKPSKKTVIPDNAVYGDGTFYGTGEGYGGPIQMKVVVAKGKMKKISVVSAEEETPEYFAKAKALIPIMLKKQTSKVDAISGATYSSNGIMEGVSKALQASIAKQKGNKGTGEKRKPTATPTVTPVVTAVPATDAPPVVQENVTEDGTTVTVVTATTNSNTDVTGTAMCYPDDNLDFTEYPISLILHVSVETLTTTTTTNGVEAKEETHSYQVTGMEFSEETKRLTTADGNWSFLKKAAEGTTRYTGVFKQLLEANAPTTVDAVSGATCSSDAIQDAFKNAMSQLP